MDQHLLRKGLKLSHLRIVAGLDRTGQLGLAAAAQGITQPAASRLLAEVEAILGQPVHRRAGRGVVLTEAGAALARRAGRILAEIEAAGRDVAELGQGAAGQVRIGSVTGPALDLVLPALRAARLALPQVSVEVEVAPSPMLADQLRDGRLDFVLGRRPRDADPALFDSHPMGEEPVSLIVRRGHRLAAGVPDHTALMGYDWVLPGPGAILREAVLGRLAALGLPPPPGRLATSSFLLTLAMLGQSNAIAPLATAVARRFASGPEAPFVCLPVDLGITVEPFALLTRAGHDLPPAAERLRQMILQVAV